MELIETLLKRAIVTVVTNSFDVSAFSIIGNILSIKKTTKYDSQPIVYDTINIVKQSPETPIGVKL